MLCRDRYIEALRLLADPAAQRSYERDVSIANVPAELVCMWFDDLNAAEPDPRLSPEDAAVISAFSAFFDSRVGRLPTAGGVAALHGCRDWAEIVAEAKKALGALTGRNEASCQAGNRRACTGCTG
jgi:hypothetical protein